MITRWWWVRHGPVPSQKGLIYGQRDVSCDTSDLAAFKGLAKTLPEDAVWVTSNLVRTHEPLRAIWQQSGKQGEPLSEPNFAEQSFGDWEGLTWDDFHAAKDPAYAQFWEDPGNNSMPGGESFADLIERVRSVIERLTDEHAGSDIVAVTHSGTIRSAIAVALGLDATQALNVVVDCLALSRIDYLGGSEGSSRGGWRVTGINLLPYNSIDR
ncbi:MAG: histidine phosphatase family protein [Rhodospirillaceae bacterium]|nr:histidine phosphatase family protein [Rhodospirillaceae bacterium]